MSTAAEDPTLAFFTAGAANAPPPTSGDPTLDFFAQNKPISTEEAPNNSRVGWAEENLAGPAEIAGSTIANIPHAAAHAAVDIARRFSPLWGGTYDEREPDPEAVRRLEVPTGAGGKQLLTDIGAMLPKRNNLPSQSDDTAIPQFGATTENVIGHALGVGQDVGSLAAGAQAVRSLAGAVPKLTATGAPEAAADAQSVVNQGAPSQSISAAGAPLDVSTASPELKSAIVEAGPAHNTEVLARHLDAEALPLPEGSTPLRLRRGQATQNQQQISDEKNLRADPETQGLLTDSITDQDQKLGASMGEIRRRATPDIVQRTNAEHGQAAVDAIKAQDNAAVTDIRAKYKALADANGGAIPLDTGAAINDVDSKLQKNYLTKTAQDNGVVSSIMDDLRSGKPISFEQFENARTRLAEVQRGGGSDGVAAGIVHDALENMPLPPEAAPLKGLADTARAAAKARFDVIKGNPAYKAAIEDNVPKVKGLHDVGADSPIAGSFMDRYALGNGPNADKAYIQRLKAAVPDPALSQSMEAAALNKLRDAAGIDSFGNGTFRNSSYKNAQRVLAPKAEALLSPESIENTERLKRVSALVNEEGPASSTSRSNTPLVLERHGAIYPKGSSVAGQVAGGLGSAAADVAAGHFGPAGVLTKRLGTTVFKGAQEAKAAQTIKDAKLKFAQEAVKPGAGLDYKP